MSMTLQAVVALDSTKFTAGLTGMQATCQKFAGAAMASFGGVATQIASMYAAFGASGAAVAGIKAVSDVGATYEQRMAAVSSVSGIAGADLVELGNRGAEAAKNLGQPLATTGTAMEALARTGINTADGLMNMLVPSLLLAGSQSADLTVSTETLAATIQAFQLPLSEAGHVADIFAGALAATPMNMDRLKDSMKMAAPAAAALSMSLEDMVAEVGAFHTVGLHGSLAGTTFRGALLECDQAARAAKGPVGEALAGWTAQSEGLTGAVRRLNAAGVPTGVVMEAFGKRAGPGMALLMKLGADAIEEVRARMISLADVQKMYDVQMDALNGNIKLFKAAMEELAKKLFSALGPALSKIVDMGKSLVDILLKLGGSLGGVGTTLAGLLPALVGTGGLLWAFNKIALVIPGVGMGLSTMFAGASASLAPTAAATAAYATKTMPMIAVACASNYKALAKNSAGYFQLTTAMSKGVMQYDIMHGAVARHNAMAYQAATATQGFLGKLNLLQAALLMVAAAFVGWKIGQWISDVKIGTKTIGEWADSLVGLAFGTGKAEEANQKMIASVQALYNSEDVAAKAREKAANEEKNWQAQLAVIRREAMDQANMEAAANKLGAQLASAKAQAFGILSNATNELGAAMAELNGVNAVTEESKNAVAEASVALKEAETELRAAIEEEGGAFTASRDATLAYNTASKNAAIANQELAVATARVNEAQDDAGDKTEYVAELQTLQSEKANAAAEANAALAEKTKALDDCNTALAESAKRVAAAQGQANDAIKESAKAVDKAITDYNTITLVVGEFGYSFDDAREAVAEFGAGAAAVAVRAHELHIPFSEAIEDAKWMAQNMDMAAGIIESSFDPALGSATDLLQRFGRFTLDVMNNQKQFGGTLDEAAARLGIYGRKLGELEGNAIPAAEAMAKMGDETLKFGARLANMNPKKLTDIKDALLDFATAFSDIKLDLSWMHYLSNFRVPHLNTTSVNNFVRNFNILATDLKSPKAMVLDWLDKLKGFRLPRLNENSVRDFVKAFNLLDGLKAIVLDLKWVDKIKELVAIDSVALGNILDVLAKIPSGTYNASVMIGWKDNDTLSSIDGSLSTLASMKGVIWA